jgi:hypothetical protein
MHALQCLRRERRILARKLRILGFELPNFVGSCRYSCMLLLEHAVSHTSSLRRHTLVAACSSWSTQYHDTDAISTQMLVA